MPMAIAIGRHCCHLNGSKTLKITNENQQCQFRPIAIHLQPNGTNCIIGAIGDIGDIGDKSDQ
jgi:hypothetical protein